MRFLYIKIIIGVWVVTLTLSLLVPQDLLELNWHDTRVLTSPTLVWICLCIVALFTGAMIEKSLYFGNKNAVRISALSFSRMAKSIRIAKILLLAVITVMVVRFAWCVYLVGGLQATLVYMITDPGHFKFYPWQETTIHGMGMLTDMIVACSIFSFAAFGFMQNCRANTGAYQSHGFNENNVRILYKLVVRLLSASLIFLTIYLLLSNERIAFVGGFLGGILVYALIRKKGFAFKKLIFVGIFLLVIWIVVESGRRQYFGAQTFAFILEHATNRLLLYFVAGVRNIDTVVNYLPDHSYGWYTLSFLLAPFQLESIFSPIEGLYGFSQYQVRPGFGVIPIFGCAFADFGWAGLSYFALFGFIYQRLHRKAIIMNDFLAYQVYGYFLVALLISFVVFLPMLARFWINVLGLVLINTPFCFGKRVVFTSSPQVT